MNINENQEFEAINQKVKERTENVEEIQQAAADTYREVVEKKQAKAVAKIIAVGLLLCGFIVGFWGLEKVGWINTTFQVVLMCVAGAMASFKIGYFFHEIKN